MRPFSIRLRAACIIQPESSGLNPFVSTQSFVDRFHEAERLFRQNQLQESLTRYQALLGEQPDHVAVLNNIGLVHERLGDYGQSAEYYGRCHEIDPAQVIFLHNLANSLSRLGRWADALPLLGKLVQTDFDHEKNAEKYALCLFNAGSKDDTKEFILSVIPRYPDNDRLNRLLGRSLLALDQHAEGLRYLQRGAGVIEFNAMGVSYHQ